MPLLSIENIDVAFGKQPPVVNEVSLQIQRGKLTAVVGESGSGKSVTALSILQLLPPSAVYANGKILFQEKDIAINLLQADGVQLQTIRGNRIATIFQEPMSSLNPVMTCGEQVAEAILQHQNVIPVQARQQAIDWFTKVQLPDPAGMYSRYPHQLSGGQKQRVMIAMAMSCQPALLICDEPTTALDVTVQQQILQLIKALQQQNNMGVLFITHDLGLVGEVADDVVVMYKGSVVERGMVQQIFQQPQHPYTKALLACRPVLYSKGQRLPVVSDFLVETEESKNSKVKSNKEEAPSLPDAGHTETQLAIARTITLIEVKNLFVSFTTKRNLFGKPTATYDAVKEVSFSIYKGETLGLVGESGCGKTTLGRTLLQLIPPTSGTILYEGKDWAACTPEEQTAMRRRMQMVFQDPFGSLNPRLTIGQALTEPLQVHNLISSAAQRKEKAIEWLEKVSLKGEYFNRYPHQFSGGQRQRIVIARALIMNPEFVVCDESVSALDASVQAQVLNLLNDLKAELGFTCLFISHDLGVVHYLSDRIMVMNKGKIEEASTAEMVYHHPQSDYTKRLIAAIPKGFADF
jgi:peptide/nickel transport system ATP-binding protein